MAKQPAKSEAKGKAKGEQLQMEFNQTKRKDLYQIDPRIIKIEKGFNTREDFGNLQELAASIVANGMLKPIEVYKDTKSETEAYFLIDGERRFKAVRIAIEQGNVIDRIPAIITPYTQNFVDRTLKLVISNDGKPLSPLELGETYIRLLNEGLSYEDIVAKTGKSLQHIYQCKEIAEMPTAVKKSVIDGDITANAAIKIKKNLSDGANFEEVIADTVKTVKYGNDDDGKKKSKKGKGKGKISLDDVDNSFLEKKAPKRVDMHIILGIINDLKALFPEDEEYAEQVVGCFTKYMTLPSDEVKKKGKKK